MKCQKCGLEAVIMSSRIETSGDQSADTQTVVNVVQEYRCRNPGCEVSRAGALVGEVKHQLFPPQENQHPEGGEKDG